MAFSTPLDLPDIGPGKQTFEPTVNSVHAPTDGGGLGAIQIGDTRWTASYTLGTLSRDLSDQWRAIHARLRGAGRWFYGRDYERPYPKAYPNGFAGMMRAGGGAFDGSATGWSQAFDGDLNAILRLDGLPPGFQLGQGDYVGFKWNTTRRALVRAVAASTDLGGGSLTVMVEPRVPIVSASGGVVPAGAVAYLNKPTCLMRRLPNDGTPADLDRTGKITSFTISGLQDLQP